MCEYSVSKIEYLQCFFPTWNNFKYGKNFLQAYNVKQKKFVFLWYITFCDVRIWHHGVYRCVLLSVDYVAVGPRRMKDEGRADDRRRDLMKGSNLPIHEFVLFFSNNLLLTTVADIRGGARDAPPLAQNFLIFMQFWGKIGQIIGWLPLWG